MKKFNIRNNSSNKINFFKQNNFNLEGGWTNEEDKTKCVMKKRNSLYHRISADIKSYSNNDYNLDIPLNEFSKKIIDSPKDLIHFYFNIQIEDNHFYNLGSFIRTIIRLLPLIDSEKLCFVIDLSLKTSSITLNYISEQLDKLILSSTSSILFSNCVIVLPDETFDNFLKLDHIDKIKNMCANIISAKDIYKILDNKKPFVINHSNYSNFNLFYNFSSQTQYISIVYSDINLPTIYAPIGHILPLYSHDFIKMNKQRKWIVCIEKVPNLYRIKGLFDKFNLIDSLCVCINNSLDIVEENKIIKLSKDFGIECLNSSAILCKIKEMKPTNIISVDLHPDAIIHQYNGIYKEFNDAVIIFGFESSGIPKALTDISTSFFQFPARSSINVVAAVSILLSSIYG